MRAITWLAVLLLALVASGARAQEAPAMTERLNARAADVVAVLQGTKPYAEVFAPVFMTAVPEAQFRGLATQLEGQFGKLQGVESIEPGPPGAAAKIALRFERAVGHGEMHLEAVPPYRVDGLRLSQFEPIGDSADKIVADLRGLPGTTNALLVPLGGGAPLLSHEPGRELAIGSTLKLYVLSALAHQIGAGQGKWSDVVTLSERSLPSGQMQDWPANAPVTLATLATMMISISDNTATDTLIRLVGQRAIDAEMVASGHGNPALNRPFLTTRQTFQLKAGSDTALEAYTKADLAARTTLLASLQGRALDQASLQGGFAKGPRGLGVEWFASARDIAGIFDRIRSLPDDTALRILAVNPSLSPDARRAWDYVGFKGGSEPGVLNLSWLLRDKAGNWYVGTLGWNDPAAEVDQQKFGLMSQRLLALVTAGPPSSR